MTIAVVGFATWQIFMPGKTETVNAAIVGNPENPLSNNLVHSTTGSSNANVSTSLLTNTLAAAPAGPPPVDQDSYKNKLKPFVDQYCIDCHGPDEQMAGIGFHNYSTTLDLLESHKTWQRVFQILNSNAMPPPDHEPQPTNKEKLTALEYLDDTLNNFDCKLVDDPGRPTIRRLNVAEYNNTIRDLVGVSFTPGDDFPSDDVGEGFDNIGDVLSLSPLLLEKYLNAAETISMSAVENAFVEKVTQQAGPDRMKTSGSASKSSGTITIASVGQTSAEFDFPATGEYLLRVNAEADQAGSEAAKCEFKLDAKSVYTAKTIGHRKPRFYEFKLKVEKGKHRFQVGFINDYYNQKTRSKRKDRNLFVNMLEVVGPMKPRRQDNLSDVHQRIVFTRPGDNGKSFDQAAKEVLEKFATKAFRRPVEPDELARLVFLSGTAANDDPKKFEEGIRVAMQAILVSPNFLFRIEHDSNPNIPEDVHTIGDYELATRLSYFIWSSMPDQELFDLARDNKLNNDLELEKQVRRMLRDSKAEALVQNFAQQWLNLRNLDEVSPDKGQFKDWSEKLRADMQYETEMLFKTVMEEDRSVLDFLDADFTFVNERLAKHYGIRKKIKGEKFQRVSLKGTKRAGVLTHASVLTLTSNPTRTSPVKRGKWIMENILGTAPPPPPPDVPDLDETAKIDPGLSLREQLAKHREDPGCAACHTTMDALGFGFEKFDPIGRYREKDGKKKIDVSAELPKGGRFNGSLELIQILKKQGDSFARAMTEKMLIYSMGRGLEYYDKCAVDVVVKDLKAKNYRFSTLVAGIVKSTPFRKRRGESPRDR